MLNIYFFLINTDGLCDMFTDVFFQNPDQRSAQLVSKRADVYNYYYTYKGSNSLSVLFSLPVSIISLKIFWYYYFSIV